MTYKFKLSRRLARLKPSPLPLTIMVVLAACTVGESKLTGPSGDDPGDPSEPIQISPHSASLRLQQSLKFTVQISNGSGQVQWSATGGAVDSNGVYTAGPTPGTFEVIAALAATGEADTSTVAVSIPPTHSAKSCTNEPSGYTSITDQPMDGVPPLAPERDVHGWRTFPTGNLAIVDDPTAPESPGNVLEIRFPTSLNGGSSPGKMERMLGLDGSGLTKWDELYVCFWLKIPQGFTNSGNVGTKMFQLGNSTIHPRTIANWGGAYVNLFGGTADQGTTGINIAGVNGLNRNMHLRWMWAPHLGEWHQFEYRAVPNTTGNADGEMYAWVDGILDTHLSDVRWYNPEIDVSQHGFNWTMLSPIYGGGPNSPDKPLSIRVDHFYISAR